MMLALLKRFIPPRYRPRLRALYARRRRIALGGLVAALLLAVGAVVATRSWVAQLGAILILAAILAGTILQVRRVQRAHAALRARVVLLERTLATVSATLYDGAKTAGQSGGGSVPDGLVSTASQALLNRGDVLDAYALLGERGSLASIDQVARRQLRNELRRRGYLVKALEVARVCADTERDERSNHERTMLEGEIAVLSGQFIPTVLRDDPEFCPDQLPVPAADASVPRVLHVVGHSLPVVQSGYSLRTHYTALAQRGVGLDPFVVTQMGFGHEGTDYLREEVDGVTYHRVPGPARGSEPLDVWLGRHVQRVANVVRVVRPGVLHAASDFLNALTALVVGREFGIPVVYESRGFWEETWLQRQAQVFGWDDLGRLAAAHGLPDVYVWRREIEDRCRRDADRVVTLAEVMADRIEAGGVPRERITVVPNGVDVAAFPVLTRHRGLAAELGIGADVTVIGYISSIVDYEGIDTLVAAYAAVAASVSSPVALLIVGDGAEREPLMRQAAALGLRDVIFTGRVAHDVVLDYYSLIDIFVVPRKPVEVCHLVTPLKPFEAFATGRAVVLSNVRALASIAEQSQAAELFEAGDERSLADVLTKLLQDPQRRRELAEAGTAWVRTERTWAANADTYTRLYEHLGAITLGTLRIPRLSADRINVDALRRGLAEREPIPLEVFSPEDARGDAEEIMRDGWSYGSQPTVHLNLPIDWSTLCMSNRSWNFSLHSWDFMAPVLRAYAHTGQRRYLDWCLDRAVSWARTFNAGDARATMAWYDMALGLRGHRLAYLVEQAVLQRAEPDALSVLLACVVRHQQEYFEDRAFNPNNNHGVFTALGELALARRLSALPGMDAMEIQGRERLETVARTQFAADGGHLEHSPEYHWLVLTSFAGALVAHLLDDDETRRRIELAREVLSWFIQPNGELVQVGDSQAHPMTAPESGARAASEAETLRVLPDSGYAIVRSRRTTVADDEAGSHLLLAGGFHSRTHKHADDLSITWFDRGREVLIDAGRYGYLDPLPDDSPLRQEGYFYSAPERRYVESTRAHNTVEADAADHVRRGRKPYGSAIRDAEERDGHYRVRAAVDHDAWRHDREIIFRPGEWLYVVDTVNATRGDARHDYRAWWNFPEELPPRAGEHGGLVFDIPGSPERLWVVELGGARLIPPVSAGRDPLRGWRSRFDLALTPAWSTGFEVLGVRDHQFRTLFYLGAQPPTGLLDHPFGAESPGRIAVQEET